MAYTKLTGCWADCKMTLLFGRSFIPLSLSLALALSISRRFAKYIWIFMVMDPFSTVTNQCIPIFGIAVIPSSLQIFAGLQLGKFTIRWKLNFHATHSIFHFSFACSRSLLKLKGLWFGISNSKEFFIIYVRIQTQTPNALHSGKYSSLFFTLFVFPLRSLCVFSISCLSH